MGNQVNVPQLFKSQYATENLLYRIAYSFTAGDMLTLVLGENGSVVWGERKISGTLRIKNLFFRW